MSLEGYQRYEFGEGTSFIPFRHTARLNDPAAVPLKTLWESASFIAAPGQTKEPWKPDSLGVSFFFSIRGENPSPDEQMAAIESYFIAQKIEVIAVNSFDSFREAEDRHVREIEVKVPTESLIPARIAIANLERNAKKIPRPPEPSEPKP